MEFENAKSRFESWIMQEGKEMVEASPIERGDLMINFVTHLVCDRYVSNMSVGWIICAEVYANARVLAEVEAQFEGKEVN